jgi:hypothetical protein
MRIFQLAFATAIAALALLAGCGRSQPRPDTVRAPNIPASFDVTLVADKDNQFDLDGAPLSEEDLKSAFRYRQEESLPMGTVLLKRGEKEKIKNEHIVELARIAHQLHFRAFIDEKGEVSEIVAQTKEQAEGKPAAPAAPEHPNPDGGMR